MLYHIAPLGAEHQQAFCRLRVELFTQLGELPPGQNPAPIANATASYYRQHLGRDLFCWGVFCGEQLVCIGAVCLFSRLPYLQNPSGLEGYILSIYTTPAHRGRGCASRMLTTILQQARQMGVGRLWLHASDQGAPLYASRGFAPKGSEMELYL